MVKDFDDSEGSEFLLRARAIYILSPRNYCCGRLEF